MLSSGLIEFAPKMELKTGDSNPLPEQVHLAGQGLVRLDADPAVLLVLPAAVLLGGAGPRRGQVALLARQAAGQPHAAKGSNLQVSLSCQVMYCLA